MNVTSHDDKNVSDVEPRTRRALEEYLTVLPEHGRVKGADGLVLVVSASGEEYVVDVHSGACECPDATYNLEGDELCKHARRARFALGRDAVPVEALEEAEVEPNFGAFVDTDDVRVATADGGVIEATDDAEILEEDDADECDECAELSDDLPCFECYMDAKGYEV
jgi:predicted nucleic acid-binding Zn finger protein